MNVSKAMVMSAGMGSRLEPLTLRVPKPLVPICNRPVMDILFEHLANSGISNVICNTYYLADQIIDRYSSVSTVNFNYIKETALSGTAGGLKKCRFFFDEGEDFVVLSADGLCDADIKRGIEIHQKSGAIATIGIKKVPRNDVSNFGVVVTDKNGFITEFQEKPSIDEAKSDFINTGIYIFNYKIFDYIPENTFYDFAKDVFPKLLGKMNSFVVDEYWSDIGTISKYKEAVYDTFEDNCKFNHAQIIDVENGRYISESSLPQDIRISGICTIGKDCRFGKNVVIENSILWDNIEVSDNVHIKDSIIASDEVVTADLCGQVVGHEKSRLDFLKL